MFAMPPAVYSAATYGGRRRGRVLSAVTAVAVAELGHELLEQIPQYEGFLLAQTFDFLYDLTAFLVPWALGASIRARRHHEAALQRHAAQLERRAGRSRPAGPSSTSGCASPESSTTWSPTT